VSDCADGTQRAFAALSIQIRRNRIAAVTEANKYHRKALHCVRTAEHMRDPGERAKLLEIARAYLGLARHVAERQDHGIAHRRSERDPRPLKDA
jgi:hypothetical protein